MSSFSLFVVVFLTVGSAVTVYGEENCNITSNVSISLNKPDACPYEPVTAQCNVTGPSNLFLSWSCDEERSVLCNQTLVNLDCEFGTVYDIASKCVCSDTVIISEATFDLSPMGDMMLYCSNRDSDQRQGVPVSAKALSTPQLYCTTVDINNNVQYEVRVWWIVNDTDTYNDVEYVVSVANSSSPTHMDITTNQTQITLNVFYGVNYTVAVTAQRCGRNVTSEPSEECLLYYPEKSSLTTLLTTVFTTVTPTSEDGNSYYVGAIVGGSVFAMIIVVIGIVIVLLFYIRYKKQSQHTTAETVSDSFVRQSQFPLREEVDSAWKDFEPVNLEGREPTQNPDDIIREDKSRKRSGVAGLYVDSDFIYYSCTEETGDKKEYFLRKCKHDGEFICEIPCYKFVRGIAMDKHRCLYVSCSGTDSEVLKLDENLNPLRCTNKMSSKYLTTTYGVFVTSDRVLVCARDRKLICVLDYDLNHHFNATLSFSPISIASIHGMFFLTTADAGVGPIDINFKENKFRENRILKQLKVETGYERFNPESFLQCICANGQHLFLTEINDKIGGRLFCLKFMGDELVLVAVQDNSAQTYHQECEEMCSPVFVTIPDSNVETPKLGEIIFSQGSYGKTFHIVKTTIIGNSFASTLMFNVL